MDSFLKVSLFEFDELIMTLGDSDPEDNSRIQPVYVLNHLGFISHLYICGKEVDTSFCNKVLKDVVVEYLVELHFFECRLDKLPGNVLSFLNLEKLSVHGCGLYGFPSEVFDLKKLTELNLTQNRIFEFPEIKKDNNNIKLLFLGYNEIGELPHSICHLTGLNELYLHHNKFDDLPSVISDLKDLRVLTVCDNAIEHLPDNIGNLKYITRLGLRNTSLKELPCSARLMRYIETLELSGTSIIDGIEDIYRSIDPVEFIDYVVELQDENTKPLNEAKVLVVGDERVGKTSIINRIIGREMNENEKSTLGIDIQGHILNSGIKVNVWDFAGQEITHQTHQFFLSARSLYLLVLDSQKEDNDSNIVHWLNTIKSASQNSPIIVVVNKRELNLSYQFDVHRYKKDFNIVDVVYVTAENIENIDSDVVPMISHTIDDLVNSVDVNVSSMSDVRLPFPPSWIAVKNRLEKEQLHQTDFIESATYEKICEENGLVNERLQDVLLSLLNQIGTIVTYNDHQRLNIMQIINPAWVTNGVYKIIRSPLIDNKAMLSHVQFNEIFKGDIKYSKRRHYNWLIDLLKQFQLAFSIDDGSVLIPSRLESAEPDFNVGGYQLGLNFCFEYKGILKKSVLSQFIVLMHEYITNDDVKYWQRGVFLKYEGSNAVVVSDEEKRTIVISIDKSNRSGKELLAIIRHAIRRINGDSFVAEEQLPLLLDDESGYKQIVGFANYDTILEAEEDDDEYIRLSIDSNDKKSHKFNVVELLDGYRITDDISFDYKRLEKDLYEISCLETENRHAIFHENEDLTNDRFKTALSNRGYKVSDQSRGGESGTELSAGERDLVIRNPHTHVAECIVEAFVFKNFSKNVVESHIRKLVSNYDTVGNKQNFVITYVKSDRFFDLWDKYKNLIPNFEDTDNGKEFIRTGYSRHGNGKFRRNISHIFINFYPGEQSS